MRRRAIPRLHSANSLFNAAPILRDAASARFLQTELLLDHPQRMCSEGANLGAKLLPPQLHVLDTNFQRRFTCSGARNVSVGALLLSASRSVVTVPLPSAKSAISVPRSSAWVCSTSLALGAAASTVCIEARSQCASMCLSDRRTTGCLDRLPVEREYPDHVPHGKVPTVALDVPGQARGEELEMHPTQAR